MISKTPKGISSIIDNSNYLRALLILIVKDRKVWSHELKLFLKEGKTLGFNKNFCEESIDNLLFNEQIDTKPPLFFDKKVALKLLTIGIQILNEDHKIHPNKLAFLETVAAANNLVQEYRTKILIKLKKSRTKI